MTRKVLFVPSCVFCPSMQAKQSEQQEFEMQRIRQFFLNIDANIITYQCPEASFKGYEVGLKRLPRGIKYYQNLSGFNEHCLSLSKILAEQIREFISCGYTVIAVIGIERSPTCAVSYMYTNEGTIHQKGIFINYLSKQLNKECIDISFVGINRNFPRKGLEEILKLLNE